MTRAMGKTLSINIYQDVGLESLKLRRWFINISYPKEVLCLRSLVSHIYNILAFITLDT